MWWKVSPRAVSPRQVWCSSPSDCSSPQGETDRWACHEIMPQVSKGGWFRAASDMVVAGKRQKDRHAMQSEVGYLFSGLRKYGREGGEGEEQREREERERETEAASSRGRWKRKRLRLQAGRKICLSQQIGEGMDVTCLLKR